MDRAAVVKAYDDFFASDCGKEFPGNIALAHEFYNRIIVVLQWLDLNLIKIELLERQPPVRVFLNGSQI